MAFDDYRLNAQVRALLTQHRIDLSQIEHGATNGVVYLRGTMETLLEQDPDAGGLFQAIERAVRALPGVRDVVLNLDQDQT